MLDPFCGAGTLLREAYNLMPEDVIRAVKEQRLPASELLQEAARLMDGLGPEARAMHDVRQWRERIRQAQQGPVVRTAITTAE